MSDCINDDTVYMMDLKGLENILIDMDGVLLDTVYDNYFWQKHIPLKYAELKSISEDQAIKITHTLFNYKKGCKDWYDIDYWSNMLNLDIEQEKLSSDMIDRIKLKEGAEDFLENYHKDKNLFLITNAHRKTLNIKMRKFPFTKYFKRVICSHELKYIKEEIAFWFILRNELSIDYEKSLLIEDTIDNIKSAYHAGLKSIIIGNTSPNFKNTPFFNDLSSFSSSLK